MASATRSWAFSRPPGGVGVDDGVVLHHEFGHGHGASFLGSLERGERRRVEVPLEGGDDGRGPCPTSPSPSVDSGGHDAVLRRGGVGDAGRLGGGAVPAAAGQDRLAHRGRRELGLDQRQLERVELQPEVDLRQAEPAAVGALHALVVGQRQHGAVAEGVAVEGGHRRHRRHEHPGQERHGPVDEGLQAVARARRTRRGRSPASRPCRRRR